MATRFIGTESTDPWLPDIVKVRADKVKVFDPAGYFDSTDVEGALAELQGNVDALVISGGGIATASTSETVAGTNDVKAVTPFGREQAGPDIDPRKYGFTAYPNPGYADGIANSAALQAAIDEACGSGDPVTSTRIANRRIVIPSGIYFLSNPINIRSVMRLEVLGAGNCELRAVTSMPSVFDINGMAYSRFGGFTITGTAGVEVDNAIYLYHDAAGSARTATVNSFHDISIGNLNFVAGIRVGKPGDNTQVDNDEYRNIHVSGAWTTGNTTRYQYGLYIGSGVFANNLVHHVYKATLTSVRYGIRLDATQLAVYGAGFDNGETCLYTTTTGYCSFSAIRCESFERLLLTTATTAAAAISMSDVQFTADAINPDGRWVNFGCGGTLVMHNIRCFGAAVQPVMQIGSGTTPAKAIIDGLQIAGAAGATFPAAACFSPTASATVDVRGYTKIGAGGGTTSIEDYQYPATTGVSAFSGSAPSLLGRTADYWGFPIVKTTTALAAGFLYMVPVFVPKTVTVDRIGAEITVLAAGSTLTLGIYSDDGNGQPGNLLLDAGTIDGGTVAAQEKTISQVLTAGNLYHLAALCQGGTPTARTLSGSSWNGFNTSLINATSAGAALMRPGRAKTGVSGTALPASASSGVGPSSAMPSIAVRIA